MTVFDFFSVFVVVVRFFFLSRMSVLFAGTLVCSVAGFVYLLAGMGINMNSCNNFQVILFNFVNAKQEKANTVFFIGLYPFQEVVD